MTYEEITERYGKGYLTDKQLDGAGAAEGDPGDHRELRDRRLDFTGAGGRNPGGSGRPGESGHAGGD